jgi:hypothetical protein
MIGLYTILISNSVKTTVQLRCCNAQALQSWIRNLHVVHVKRTSPSVKKALPSLVQEFVQNEASTIIHLARKVNYPPYLLLRFLLEQVTTLQKKSLTEALRNPTEALSDDLIAKAHELLSAARLVAAVELATAADPMYGPIHDRDRHMVGIEYEVVLEYKLRRIRKCFAKYYTEWNDLCV